MTNQAELGLWTELEYQEFRGVGIEAVRLERAEGRSPPYVKIGRQIFYPIAGIKKYIAANTITPRQPPTLTQGPSRRRAAAA